MNYLVANWKANKSIEEAKSWIDQWLNGQMVKWSNGQVIICAPFTVLATLKEQLAIKPSSHVAIFLGAQDLSPFPSGAYTGEVSAEMLKALVDFVIVGHSERRQNFGETDEIVAKKVKQALEQEIKPIVCLDEPYLESQIKTLESRLKVDPDYIEDSRRSRRDPRHKVSGQWNTKTLEQLIFAYEPLRAIGTGKPDTPENANQVAKRIKEAAKFNVPVIYGGSVTEKNVKAFVDQENINGVLVGGASLKVEEFRKIIQACK